MTDLRFDLPGDDYVEDVASGDGWTLHLGDSCEVLPRRQDDSVDLSVYSPPFASLYTYSPSPRDIGNCSTREEFLDHYGFVIREVLRVTKPGRLSCVHIADEPLRKSSHGYMGLRDLPGDIIRAHEAAGWIYFGRVTVNKNPQVQAQRTKSHPLMFVTKNRDSAGSRPALADYLLIFKKHGDNAVPIATDVTNDEWIDWAQPVWLGIKETHTLNHRPAREEQDEKHIAPLQLDFIERCVRLWSNPGELVLSPFAGIGSELYTAVKLGRRGLGIELKASYWRTAIDNLRGVEAEAIAPALFPDKPITEESHAERSS